MEGQNSPYKPLTDHFFNRYEKGASNKHPFILKYTDPKKVAHLIVNVSEKDHPQLRYRVGIDSHLYYWIDRILPWSLKEYLLRKFY